MEQSEQNRRRTLVATVVIVLSMVALLSWFLLHPSSGSSPARKLKNAIFGPRMTEAAEQFASERNGGHGRSGSGQNQETDGAKPGSSSASGSSVQGGENSRGPGVNNSGDASARGTGSQGSGGMPGPRTGTPLSSPVTSPANPHDPTNQFPDLPAPEARSIGWLDRFFGTQRSDDSHAVRAGLGGTGETVVGTGNSNDVPASPTSPPVAAEFTTTNSSTPAEVTLQEPLASIHSTNRAAPANSTLNDNFEQLLRQHRAGSGDVRISLMWSNRNDLDLHVVDPRGEEIFYGHRLAQSGGLLDIDMNASPPLRVPAVENVFWPRRAAPLGQYHVYVNHYRRHDAADLTPFTVRVLVRGQSTDINGSIRFGEPKKMVYQFNLAAAQP